MKNHVRVLLTTASISYLALAAIPRAQAQYTPKLSVLDKVMGGNLSAKAAALPLDDYLATMTRDAQVNVFADATNFAEKAPSLDVKANDTLAGMLYGLQNARDLVWARPDAKTFLLWSSPDVRVLAQDVVRQGIPSLQDAAPFKITGADLDAVIDQINENGESIKRKELLSRYQRMQQLRAEYDADAQLTPYLQKTLDWKEGDTSLVKTGIALRDLPQDASASFLRLMRLHLAEHQKTSDSFAVFNEKTDALWKKARLAIVQNGSRQLVVLLPRPQKQSEMMKLYLVNLDQPDAGKFIATDSAEYRKIASSFAEPVADPLASTLFGFERVAALESKVNIAAKSQPLSELVTNLQTQSRVTLTCDLPRLGKSLVSAHATQMPLADAMMALAQLYDVRWEKSGDAYAMRDNDHSAIEQRLLQLGDMQASFIAPRMVPPYYQNRIDSDRKLSAAVTSQLGAALVSSGGGAFSDLSEDLQSQIRQKIEMNAAEQVVSTTQRVAPASAKLYSKITLGSETWGQADRRGNFVQKGGVSSIYFADGGESLKLILAERNGEKTKPLLMKDYTSPREALLAAYEIQAIPERERMQQEIAQKTETLRRNGIELP